MSSLAINLPHYGTPLMDKSYAESRESRDVLTFLIDTQRFSGSAASAPQSAAIGALAHIATACGRPDWDGYGAKPIDDAAIARTLAFLNDLPTWLPAPEIVPEADGEVAVEWDFGPNRIFSISIGKSGAIHYAGLFGEGIERHGTEPYKNVVPSEILRLIIKLIETCNGPVRFAA